MSEHSKNKTIILPYDRSNPVIYDNDSAEDVYTDEYLMALAGSGDINLRGLITTASYASSMRKSETSFEWGISVRKEIVGKASRSGMKNIPDAVGGPSVDLVRPASGRIEDTVPIGSQGAKLIIEEAKLATPQKPLVIIMGGQATAMADAYLMDNSIVENVVLAWSNRWYPLGYNGMIDIWSTYIIMSKFIVVEFDYGNMNADPYVPKQRLIELPDTELRQWMMEKELPHVSLPGEHDFDVHPAIALMRPDYVTGVRKQAVSHLDSEGIPVLKDDENGNILMVTEADKEVATDEWWRALKNPLAYGGNPKAPSSSPYNGKPIAIPGIVNTEEFDYGGEGVSYHCRGIKNETQWHQHLLSTAFRATDHFKIDYCSDIRGDYVIELLEMGEWLNYTVDVRKAGKYRIDVRATTQFGFGAILHLEFNGINKSGPVNIPSDGGWKRWHRSIFVDEVELDAGEQIMRLVCDNGKCTLNYIGFDYL